MNPSLALGQSIHKVIESLSHLPVEERFHKPLSERFDKLWSDVSGEKGGFESADQEATYKQRGYDMLSRVEQQPGPILHKALKIKQDLPHYWLSEEDNLILCGKIDWIEYIPGQDSIHVIDFKTGRRKEKSESLQLPIYLLLLKNTQTRAIEKMSYWYLESEDIPTEVTLPDYDEALEQVMSVGKRIKLARQLNHFSCKVDDKTGCIACAKYDAVVKGRGTFVGVGEYNKEVYTLSEKSVAL